MEKSKEEILNSKWKNKTVTPSTYKEAIEAIQEYADQETAKLKEELKEAKKLLEMFNSICESTYGKEMFAEWIESKEYQNFLNKTNP